MSNLFSSSKEEIKNRILKKAQELWGVDKVYDFDPLVVLMMEVLSGEIFNISNDIYNLEDRIYDKISRILASDSLVGPLPAHGIIQCHPLDENVILKPKNHFTLKKKLNGSLDSLVEKAFNIDFSSLHNVRLFRGSVKYMATSKSLFEISPNQPKRLLNRSSKTGVGNVIWLGINCEASNKVDSFSGLNFYFDWGNYLINREIYDSLIFTKWTINNSPVNVFRNRYMDHCFQDNDLDLFSSKKVLMTLSQDIEAFYHSRFLTLDYDLDPDIFVKESVVPHDLKQQFDGYAWTDSDRKLEWVRIEFSSAFNIAILEELNIVLNAFPVVNKRLFQSKNRLGPLRNIVPIETNNMEQLFTIEEVSDDQGVNYSEVPSTKNMHNDDVGYYTIRHGNVERLDSRGAKDMVDYLFELIRDEKAAFSYYDSDFLSNVFKEIDKNFSLIETKVDAKIFQIKELKNYIIFNPKKEVELMFMDAWLTYADLANGIGVSSVLEKSYNTPFVDDNIVFLTTTTGGRSRLSRSESVQAFKYGITTSDKVVTKNDVINFIKYELNTIAEYVELKNGLVLDSSVNKGFYNTFDIHIHKKKSCFLLDSECKNLLNQALSKLEVRSVVEYKYRLFLDNILFAQS